MDNRENSDIDIAITTFVDEYTEYKIMDEFDKLDIEYKMDLVFIKNIKNENFIKTILQEGKKI